MSRTRQHQLGDTQFHGGWNPQRPDHRDRAFAPTVSVIPDTFELPGIADIPRIDQGQQGSCVAHGTAGVVMYDQYKQGESVVIPSRAMIYYDARIPEGTTQSDSGAQVRDGVGGVAQYGVCPDSEFPYNDQVFDVAPTTQDYADATKQEALVYEAVAYPHIDAALASGYPVVYGRTVYVSMMSQEVAQTGIIPIPTAGDSVDGGHCTYLFGYNMTDEEWASPSGLVYPPRSKAGRNSWRMPDGTWWGTEGNYFSPQWYWDNGLCSDHWVIRRIGAASN